MESQVPPASDPINPSTRSRISCAALLVNVTARTSLGPGVPAPDEIGDPIGNDARFARAGARENEQRPVAVQHGVALFRIQLVEEVHCPWGELQYTVVRGRGLRGSATRVAPAAVKSRQDNGMSTIAPDADHYAEDRTARLEALLQAP